MVKTLRKFEKGGFGYEVTKSYVEFYTIGNDNMKLRFGMTSQIYPICLTHIQNANDNTDITLLQMAAMMLFMGNEYSKGQEFTKIALEYLEKFSKEVDAKSKVASSAITDEEDEANLNFVKDAYAKQKFSRAERRRMERLNK